MAKRITDTNSQAWMYQNDRTLAQEQRGLDQVYDRGAIERRWHLSEEEKATEDLERAERVAESIDIEKPWRPEYASPLARTA